MKTLLIANASSLWAKEFIREVWIPAGHKVYLTAYEKVSKELLEFYRENKVEILPLYDEHGREGKLKKFFALKNQIKEAAGGELFDGIIVQGMPTSFQAFILPGILRAYGKRSIGVFIGSDILRAKEKHLRRLIPCLKEMTYINLGTEQLEDTFVKVFGHKYDEKIVRCKYGSLAFSAIKEAKEKGEKGRENFSIPSLKTTVAIGYNGNEEQQHGLVIDQLKQLTEQVKDNLHLLIHLGYGLPSKEYEKMVREKLEACGISYTLIMNMLDFHQVAQLRLSTDIFIQAQISDALSSSVRECLYAGSYLINPSWIDYREFDQIGIDYIKYDKIEEIKEIVDKVYHKKIVIDKEDNSKRMYREYSWEALKQSWVNLYNE